MKLIYAYKFTKVLLQSNYKLKHDNIYNLKQICIVNVTVWTAYEAEYFKRKTQMWLRLIGLIYHDQKMLLKYLQADIQNWKLSGLFIKEFNFRLLNYRKHDKIKFC